MSISTLLREAEELQPDVVRLRRTIHRRPELGLQLPRTQATILQALDGLGLRIRAPHRGGPAVPGRQARRALRVEQTEGREWPSGWLR